MVPDLPDHSRDALGLCLRDPTPCPSACPGGACGCWGQGWLSLCPDGCFHFWGSCCARLLIPSDPYPLSEELLFKFYFSQWTRGLFDPYVSCQDDNDLIC